MRVLGSAQAFGFGPVAKLVSLAAQLHRSRIHFIGSGIALDYARLNGKGFTDIDEFDLSDIPVTRAIVRQYDSVISVMEPMLVYAAVRERVPVRFFDSLFGFWIVGRGFAELGRVAEAVRLGSDEEAAAAFGSLSVHESMVVAHMMATESFAQAFPGVTERVDLLALQGFESTTVTGAMVDLGELNPIVQRTPRTLVANLGGFTNAFLDYEKHGAYVDVMLRWLERMAADGCDFDEIIVCSGAFRHSRNYTVNGVRLRIGLLPHADLLELLSTGPVYMAPPGLTSLHEAAALEVPVMLLPDQHHGHRHNRESLAGTLVERYGASFGEAGFDKDNPDDDLAGTLALADLAAQIDKSPELFKEFADYADRKLSAFIDVCRRDRRAYVRELQRLTHGVPIAEVIRRIDVDEHNAELVS
ncbi:hypothetical protein [Streptomyces canus]|uniref:hypothetical protein n=1 Tax=Streptomyces canus TaxID=58343 RepID=UPI0003788651|nr:hypothetical protein [Streptomyces canus]